MLCGIFATKAGSIWTKKNNTIRFGNGSTRIWKGQHDSTLPEPPFCRTKKRAISWFRDSAREHIAWIRGLVAILENHGVAVQMLKSNHVGYIVYEDEYQVVAEPFADMHC